MAILIDAQAHDLSLGDTATLREAMALVYDKIHGQGRVVVKVEFDGRALEGTALDEAMATPIQGKSLMIISAEPREMSLTILGKLAALVEFIDSQQRHIASLFDEGKNAKALELLASQLGAWQQISQSYSGLIRLMRVPVRELAVNERSIADLISEFHQQLLAIQEALQNNDLVLLADLIRYEMETQVGQWMRILEVTLGFVDPQGNE